MSENAKSWMLFLSRLFMGGMFMFTGFRKWIGIAGASGFTSSSKFVASQMGVSIDVAQILLGLAIALEIIAGAMLVLGYRTKLAAIGLIIFVIILTPFFHGPWNFQMPRALNEFDQCLKNLNLIGCMLLYCAFGAGSMSLDAKSRR